MKVANILLVASMFVGSTAFAVQTPASNSACPHSNKVVSVSTDNTYLKTFFAQPAPAPARKSNQGGGSATREGGNGKG